MAGFFEAFEPKDTGITATARHTRIGRRVAARRHAVVHPEFDSSANDLLLGPIHEGSVDHEERTVLNTCLGGESGHFLKGFDELRATIRIATIVHGVHADEDVVRADDFSPRQSVRKKDGVARRYVGYRYAALLNLVKTAVFRHGYVVSEGRSAEHTQVDGQNHMLLDSEFRRDVPGCIHLDSVSLPIGKGQRKKAEPICLGDRECRR